jgi:hypothetical protein
METRIILVRVKSVARLPVSPSTVSFPHQPEPFHPSRQTTVPSSEAKAPIFHADYILWNLWKECQISVVVFWLLPIRSVRCKHQKPERPLRCADLDKDEDSFFDNR